MRGCFGGIWASGFGRRRRRPDPRQHRMGNSPKLERLVGLTLILILRYAIPRASSECLLAEMVESDELAPMPRPRCRQGVFNRHLSRCECDDRWRGAECNECVESPCIRRSRVFSVRPLNVQSSEFSSIRLEGIGFPRTLNHSYHCLFNNKKTNGHWIDENTVDCLPPLNLTNSVGYEISLIPFGLQRVIRMEEMVYFDIYDVCNVNECKGVCFRGKCICRNGQSGDYCDGNTETELPKCSDEETSIQLNATEFKPFSYFINSTDIPSSIMSSQKGVYLDPLSGNIEWKQPIGNSEPLRVDFEIRRPDCRALIHLDISVPQTYQPVLTSVTKHKQSNVHRVAGFIKFNGSSDIADSDLPVLLRIFVGDQFIEELEIRSRRRFFAHDVFPYIGNRRELFVFAEHPNPLSNSTPGLPFTPCVLDGTFEKNLLIGDGDFVLHYSVKSESCACGEWAAQIVAPRQLIRVHSQKITGDASEASIQMVISLDRTVSRRFDSLYVAISCDMSATFTAVHSLSYARGNATVVSPERLDVRMAMDGKPAFVEVSVFVNSVPPISPSVWSSSPFFLVASPIVEQWDGTSNIVYVFGVRALGEGILRFPSNDEPIFSIPYRIENGTPIESRLPIWLRAPPVADDEIVTVSLTTDLNTEFDSKPVRLNSFVQFDNLPPGIYFINVESVGYWPSGQSVTIPFRENSLEILLSPKFAHSVALSPFNVFSIRRDVTDRPEVIVEPKVVYSTDRDFWMTFRYVNGPPNSIAMINGFALRSRYRIDNLPYDIGICSGCGYRHRVRVILDSDHQLPADTVNIIRIPYVYTIPGNMRDYRRTTSIIVDLRKDPKIIPQVEFHNEPQMRFSPIYSNCSASLLSECRRMFRRTDICSNGWKEFLSNRVPSIPSFMGTIRFLRNCSASGLSMSEFSSMLRCVISANMGSCEVVGRFDSKSLECTQRSSSLADRDNLINTIAVQMELPRFKICRLINGFFRFLHYLESLVPLDSEITGEVFDRFLNAVSNESDLSDYITLAESTEFHSTNNGLLRLISNWNGVFEATADENSTARIPEMELGSRSDGFVVLSALVETAVELSEISVEMGSESPLLMLDRVLSHLLRQTTDQIALMDSFVSVEPKCGGEVRPLFVHLLISNPPNGLTIRNINPKLHFERENATEIDYRLMSTLFDSRLAKVLVTGRNFSVHWKLMPQFDFRLTKSIIAKAVIDLHYEVNRTSKIQRIQSHSFSVEPATIVRSLVFLHPQVFNKMAYNPNPFSILIVVINVGYLQLTGIHLVNIRPEVVDPQFRSAVEFSLDSVEVDDRHHSNVLELALGRMASGESRQIRMNLTTIGQSGEGYLKNLSMSTTLWGTTTYPDSSTIRKFYIRRQINSNALLVSEVADPYPLYYYRIDDAKLASLEPLFFIQVIVDNCRRSVVQSFQLADETKRFDVPLYVNTQWPLSVNSCSTLIGILQIYPNFDLLYRAIDQKHFWVSEDGKEITFIDLTPIAKSFRIYYQLVFGEAECLTYPAMMKSFLQIQYPKYPIPQYSMVAQLNAANPNPTIVGYALRTVDEYFPFAIYPDSGIIIAMNETIDEEEFYCARLFARTQEGPYTGTDLQFGNGNPQKEKCHDMLEENFDHLYLHGIADPSAIPFNLEVARNNFVQNSLIPTTATESPTTTTTASVTEIIGEQWTSETPANISTTTSLATPHPTPQLITPTTTEPIHTPDSTLSVYNFSRTPMPSVSPDETLTTVLPSSPSSSSPSSTKPSTTTTPIPTTVPVVVVDFVPPSRHRPPFTTRPPQQQNDDDILVNLITMATPPTTSALPVAAGVSLRNNGTFSAKTQIDFGAQATSAAMVDMACKMRATKPMYSVLCDMAKTVYRTQA